MVVITDIDEFTVKRILVGNGSSSNMLTWELAITLQIDLGRLKKVGTWE